MNSTFHILFLPSLPGEHSNHLHLLIDFLIVLPSFLSRCLYSSVFCHLFFLFLQPSHPPTDILPRAWCTLQLWRRGAVIVHLISVLCRLLTVTNCMSSTDAGVLRLIPISIFKSFFLFFQMWLLKSWENCLTKAGYFILSSSLLKMTVIVKVWKVKITNSMEIEFRTP